MRSSSYRAILFRFSVFSVNPVNIKRKDVIVLCFFFSFSPIAAWLAHPQQQWGRRDTEDVVLHHVTWRLHRWRRWHHTTTHAEPGTRQRRRYQYKNYYGAHASLRCRATRRCH